MVDIYKDRRLGRGLLTLFCLLFVVLGLEAIELRRDFSQLANQYRIGRLDTAADQLSRLRPSNDEERAFVLYYGALLNSSVTEAKQTHQQNYERYRDTYHGQLSLLELAKTSILEHSLEEARIALRSITHPDISQRHYWQAVTALHMEQYADAASFADTYLRINPTGEYVEQAYYILADAQSAQGRYQNAVSTLNRLLEIDGLPANEQYFQYRLGRAYEDASNYTEALRCYRRAFERNQYSQVAYQVEDRLFAMRARNSSIDISWLYPYTLIEDPIPAQADTTIASVSLPGAQDGPLKASGRPTQGYYLQAGRFSSEDNAISRTRDIRSRNLPSVYFEEMQSGRMTWVVMSGPFESATESETARNLLLSYNIDCFAIRY